MDDSALHLHTYRRRIARIVRRAESRPENAARFLRDETNDLLVELKRLARAEPAVVLDVLLHLLDRLVATVGGIQDSTGHAAALISEVISRIQSILVDRDSEDDQKIDRPGTIRLIFQRWVDDPDGHLLEIENLLFEVAKDPRDEREVVHCLRDHLAHLPLIFPTRPPGADDLSAMLLQAERHRIERLLGEILACRGSTEFSVVVARDHYVRTGDALDLVTCLRRAGELEEAVALARRALTSPRAFHRQRIQELLEEMVLCLPPTQDRKSRRELERHFLAEPTIREFHAIKRRVPKEQWSIVRTRLLRHLHRQQKAPSLLFSLYLEEGDFLEADGVVRTMAIDPNVLARAAKPLMAKSPHYAAGWLLVAAHRRTDAGDASAYPKVVDDLLLTREAALLTNQAPAFANALRNFRSKYANRPRLIALLNAAGLQPERDRSGGPQ